MKSMTCNQLGGACELAFTANSFEEMASLSQNHGREMAKKNDEAHLKVMDEIRKLMHDPQAMQDWMRNKQNEFDRLPNLATE